MLYIKLKFTQFLQIFIFTLCTLCTDYVIAQNKSQISIIPYPQEISLFDGYLNVNSTDMIFVIPSTLKGLIPIIEGDIFNLFGASFKNSNTGNIIFRLNDKLEDEEYKLIINDQITIEGKSQKELLLGWTSLLQLGKQNADKIAFPKVNINDKPHLQYRGLLVDVARKFQSISSLKQIVEMCRWYKINYIQLHLNDDQLFVFPSLAFPKLATKGKSYSRTELLDLVAYAANRGVIFVPELDAPGHTGTMRKAYPEIFGNEQLGMMDVSNQKAIDACKILAGEMMEIFHTSPYFHIGADEVWMAEFIKLPQVEEVVKMKNLDSPHDLYLDYIVQMHDFVKSKGLKTIMWESFENNGSEKVKIPTDILLYAWETMYQTPTSLRDNGYTLLNASWKPIYITPTIRWTLEQIYNWNIWRWEHFLPQAPAWNPIQFGPEDYNKVIGTQLCAWEMTEEMTLPAIQERLAGLSENAWNIRLTKNYKTFENRYNELDTKLSRILFPATLQKSGFDFNKHERFYNYQNWFANNVTIDIADILPNTTIYYTSDGTVPTIKSKKWNGVLKIDTTVNLRFGIFKNEQLIGYKTELFEKRPLKISFQNEIIDQINPIQWIANFKENIIINVEHLAPNIKVHYTLDGSIPSTQSKSLVETITFNDSVKIRIQAFKNQRAFGEEYKYTFNKK